MKIVSRILNFFILIICLMLQISFFEYLELFSINFDLIMVIIIAITLFNGTLWGVLAGFTAGMVLDLMTGNIVGISAFVYAVNAFIAGKLIAVEFKSKILSCLFVIFIITEINILMVSLIYYLFNFDINWTGMGMELITGPVLNIVLMFIFFPLVRGISRIGGESKIESRY